MDSQIKTVFTLLKYTYGLVPIVAGLDKFTNILTDWSQYISSGFVGILPFEARIFMIIVGVIEVIAGIMVLSRPKIGGYIVMVWLIAIALTLLFGGHYIDVAVRDIVMAIGAFSLVKLADSKVEQ
ncbi:hypothetical protein ATE84_1918 [Aquimarina sp. MAR_2010_214]|uniref:hypothetical protein n=1 Tax=Aquimarina sp. MAR_2010_214 TaxID=1250026 RepID=UPI000C714724|nr:hypothetical protein [Aquimarina sp. MAR_2010_214]PKV49879.1 hypothetical protein ATE84_1918 [Aquimarina sp. MAR_2010_214]